MDVHPDTFTSPDEGLHVPQTLGTGSALAKFNQPLGTWPHTRGASKWLEKGKKKLVPTD